MAQNFHLSNRAERSAYRSRLRERTVPFETTAGKWLIRLESLICMSKQ